MPATTLTMALIAGFLTVFGFVAPEVGAQEPDKVKKAAQNAYDFSFTAINGDPLPLSSMKGKVVLVVNTASRCGFTPQYEGLEKLYEGYKGKGVEVLVALARDDLALGLDEATGLSTIGLAP